MAAQHLANYLKTYRKKSGLTQCEVAFLLGWKHGEQLLRYEKHHRVPTLQVALACEAIFKAPVAELFAGTNDSVVRETGARIATLAAELRKKGLQGKQARYAERKLSWLASNHDRSTSSP